MRNLAFNCSAWVGMGPGVFLLAALLAAPAGAVPFNTIFERDPDQISLGDDIFYANYDSFQDLIDNNTSSFGPTQIGLGTPTSLSVGGVAFDGSQYHILFERDPDLISLGDDIFYANYDSFQDLIDNNTSSFGPTQIGLGTPTSLSIGGVAFDGSQYHVLFERDPDQISLGDDIFYTTYDSFQDLIDNNASSFGLTQIGLGTPTSLSVRGLSAFVPEKGRVPEPSALALFAVGLAGLGFHLRRLRKAA